MRSLVIASLGLFACTDDEPATPDTHTDAIVAQVCTSDPCPVNSVPVGDHGTLTFVLYPDGTSFLVGSPKLKAGASGLYVEHPRFEAWPEGASAPTPNPSDPNATTNVNLTANTETVLTPSTINGSRLALSYDAIGPHR